MIFDGKPTSQISEVELRGLVDERVEEDLFLDFKRSAYGNSDRDKFELLKDVVAFANAAGGYLIIGVEEDGEGRAQSFMHVDDAERIRRSIIDRCLQLIDPRLPELDVRVITIDGDSLVVCRIPESARKPHCALPDREHHYFWRRYNDGNKLMTAAEIHEMARGDLVYDEVRGLRQDLQKQYAQEAAARELERDVNESELSTLSTTHAVLEHAERLFVHDIGSEPYFRVCAMPVVDEPLDLKRYREDIRGLLLRPPSFREGGFDVGPRGLQHEITQSSAGLHGRDRTFHFLQFLWNGYIEFRTQATGWMDWGMEKKRQQGTGLINPLAMAESTASFVVLATRCWSAAELEGLNVQFRLGLYNMSDWRLRPHALGTIGQIFGGMSMGDDPALGEGKFIVDVKAGSDELPGKVACQLVSEVYYRVGYEREEVPYFDEGGNFVYAES